MQIWTAIDGMSPGPVEHEHTHYINNDIRNQHSGCNAAWADDIGMAAIIPEPPLTLAQIAQAVTVRGDIYELYLVRQRGDWNDHPLYLLDELSAYSNGTDWYRSQESTKKVMLHKGHILRRMGTNVQHVAEMEGVEVTASEAAEYSHKCALEMLGYCKVLLGLCQKSSYDFKQLQNVLDYYDFRLSAGDFGDFTVRD